MLAGYHLRSTEGTQGKLLEAQKAPYDYYREIAGILVSVITACVLTRGWVDAVYLCPRVLIPPLSRLSEHPSLLKRKSSQQNPSGTEDIS